MIRLCHISQIYCRLKKIITKVYLVTIGYLTLQMLTVLSKHTCNGEICLILVSFRLALAHNVILFKPFKPLIAVSLLKRHFDVDPFEI